jgi:type IV pilus assembly protein PilB
MTEPVLDPTSAVPATSASPVTPPPQTTPVASLGDTPPPQVAAAPEPEVTPEQLDELARQVEATVFGSSKTEPTSPTSAPLVSSAPVASPFVSSAPLVTPVVTPSTVAPVAPVLSPTPPPVATPSIPPTPTISDQTNYTTILEVFLADKLLTQEQIDKLKQEFLISGRAFEDLVAEKQWLTEEQLTKAKATFNHIPFVSISETGISPEALGFIDQTVAKRYGVLPFAVDKMERTLSVAMRNPLDIQAIDFVEQKTGFKLIVFYATPGLIDKIITERYAQSLSVEVDEALKDTNQTKVRRQVQQDSVVNFGGVIRDAPINRIVETILDFAVKARASDIHIEPLTGKVRVRYRIDGILVEKLVLPKSVLDAVVSRIKILSNLKIDEKRMPQDGRFNYTTDQHEVDLRVSTLPTVNGEKINLRLLEKNASVPTLEELGLSGMALTNVLESIKVPHGIILVAGPTGSGKTTTLYSVLHLINSPKVNILTLEDPVEYQMTGVNQVQINPKAGLTFASGLRSFLRQDPNVIMIGEMRDSETTELAIQASLTGHLVFSTIHTSSAAGTLPRMIDMGAETFLIASSMTLVISQRIVRLINPEFKEEYEPDPVVVEDLKKVLGPQFEAWHKQAGKDPNHVKLYRPASNKPEGEPEYKGRIGIFEVMRMTDKVGKLIMENRPANEIEAESVSAGMLLMKQDGYIKVLEGKTTLEEVVRVAEV